MNVTTALPPFLTLHPTIQVPDYVDRFTGAPYFDYVFWPNCSDGSCLKNATNSTAILPEPVSKYASWEIIVIATLTAITAIVTVLGNILVLVSFVVERALRQPSNFFIASLAVTDLLIGLFSMPAYSTYLLLERWPMPNILCDLWLSLDYTVCLVSQYNVLLITIDRFCSVKIPAKYRNWRTRRKVQIMIIATWIIPSGIFFTIHLGWDTMVNGGERGMDVGSCDAQYIKANPTFNVVLIFSYFWSTMVVLLILYAGIYQTAFSLQRKSQAKHEKMQQMVRLGSSSANKVVDTAKQTGFLTVHTLKPPVHDVSVVFNSVSVTQGGRATENTCMDIVTPQKGTDDSGSTEPDRSSSPSFPSDADQPEDGKLPHATGQFGAQNRKPPVKGGTTAKPRVFRDLKQRVVAKAPRTRGRTEIIVPNVVQPPAKFNKNSYKDFEDNVSLIQLIPREDCDDLRGAGGLTLGSAGVTSSMSSVERASKHPLTLPCISQSTINTSTLQTILLAKELNDEIRQLFAQRANPQRSESAAPLTNSAQGLEACVEPVWIPRVPFPVRFDEMPSGLLLPFTGQTPLNRSNDWRFIDQESLKSPNSSIEGTHVSTPSNRSSFNSPLLLRNVSFNSPKQLTPRSSLKSKSSTPSTPTGPAGPFPYNGVVPPPTLKVIRPAPRVSIRPEVSDIGEESTRYDSDQRSAFADHDQTPLSNHFSAALADTSRNNSERLRSFGRRIRQAAARGSKRKSIAKRQQSRSENRARKALKTITFIMGAFVLCWTPWHICATIEGFCNGCVHPGFYALSYWLCYLNSPINPFCYALANQQFKKTFIRVLNRDFHRT